MSIVSSIADMITGGGYTGITTIVTGLGQGWLKVKELKVNNEHQLAMAPHNLKMLKYEIHMQKVAIEANKYMADKKLLEKAEEVSGLIRASAINADMREAVAALKMKGQKWWVGAIRTLNRPLLTWVTLLLVWLITIRIIKISVIVPIGYEINPMLVMTLGTLTVLTEAAFGFWFGSRSTGSRAELVNYQR